MVFSIPWPLRLEGKVAGAGIKRRKVAKDLKRKTGEKLDGNCTSVMWYLPSGYLTVNIG